MAAASVTVVTAVILLLLVGLRYLEDQIFQGDMKLALNSLNDGNRSHFMELAGRHRSRLDDQANSGFIQPYIRSRFLELDRPKPIAQSLYNTAVTKISLNKQRLAVAYIDNRVELIDLQTEDEEFLEKLQGETVAFSPDGKYLAVIGRDRPLSVLNLNDGTHRQIKVGSKSSARDLKFVDSELLICFSDGRLQMYSTSTLDPVSKQQVVEDDGLWRARIAVSPDKQTIAVAIFLALSFCLQQTCSAQIQIRADFPGGSAVVVSNDAANQSVHVQPQVSQERGWPCWWYFLLQGLSIGEPVSVTVSTNSTPFRAGRVLSPAWSLPDSATISSDNIHWQHTPEAEIDGQTAVYTFEATAETMWVAWGPPFLPSHAEALLKRVAESLPNAVMFELARTRGSRRGCSAVRIGLRKT